jgi:hypothetical protein
MSEKVNPRTCFLADLPKFGKPLNNLTISVGREAVFACIVENLGPYKVSTNSIIKNVLMYILNIISLYIIQ